MGFMGREAKQASCVPFLVRILREPSKQRKKKRRQNTDKYG